jgi:putative membrane protein
VAGAALLLSFLGAIVAFAGFSLVRDGERLRIRRGLLARRAASVPLARVHAVDVVEGVLRRPFGLASVRMETAGYRSEAAAAQTLLPLVRVRDVSRVLAEFVPALADGAEEQGPLEQPPARARRRYALPPAIAGAVVGAALVAIVPAAWPALPALLVLGAVEGLLRHGSAGWRDDGRRLVLRGRVVARRTLLARVDRLQEHALRASLLQRRASLADFQASVGSGRTGRVRHLEAGVAGALFERLRLRRL